jgi:ElaB/YqjD/DUF883 family membrane-anchored ribosome-binding protein
MERNEFPSGDSTLGQSGGSTQNDSGFGSSGSSSTQGAGSAGTNAGGSSTSGDVNTSSQGLADRARNLAGNAQDKLADVGSTVRERAGTLKDSLADALTTGADKLRQRGTSTGQSQLAGATGTGSVAVEGDGRTAQVTERVASGMTATADWLRDADLEGLRTSIEGQVKEHPGRTLLIAAGLGYLLGKALRK